MTEPRFSHSLRLAPVIVEQLLPTVRHYAQESRCAVILVEQQVRLALGIADHGYVMSRGRITTHGPAAQLRADHDLSLSSYLGDVETPHDGRVG